MIAEHTHPCNARSKSAVIVEISFMKAAYHAVLIVGFALSIHASCNKSAAKVAVDERLVGGWQWIRTDGGIANNIHETPASTGKEKVLFLRADHTYSISINNVPESEGHFNIESKKCIHDGETKPFIRFEHDPS